jgi:futalosine hydrolase
MIDRVNLHMHVLLAAATPFEIKQTLEQWKGTTLITGVGLVSATYQLHKALTASRPHLVVQAGIAGCFDPTQPRGTVMVVSEDAIGDQGVEEGGGFRDLFELNLLEEDRPPYQQGRLPNPHLDHLNLAGLPRVRSVSVNEISTNPARIGYYQKRYNAVLESMEGAALHYVCLQEGIPFVQIRSVSNHVGDRDKTNWEMGKACTHLNEALLRFLTSPLL